jgi:Fic family protein
VIEFGALLNETIGEYTLAVDRVAALRSRLDRMDRPHFLIAPLMRREAIQSSKIENTIATAEEVAVFEARHETGRPETIEVANYRQALSSGMQSELPLCRAVILEMHKILLGGTRGDHLTPGRFRSAQNWIGNDEHRFSTCRFVPPPPDQVEGCIDDLIRYLRDEKHAAPLIAIGCSHYQFEAIHPFGDGNGRLGRLLVAMSLCQQGLIGYPVVYVSGYFEDHRDEYYRLLREVSLSGAWTEWTRFFLTAVAEQAADTLMRLDRLETIRKDLMERLSGPQTPVNLLRLVEKLIEFPAVEIRTVAEWLGVTRPTASGYVRRLEAMGFLREWTGGGYARLWVAQPVIDVIE